MPPESMMWAAIATACFGGSAILTALVLGPIGRAIGDRIRGRRNAPPEEAGEISARIGRLEDLLEGRLGELEDRLAFTERVLGDGQDPITPAGGVR